MPMPPHYPPPLHTHYPPHIPPPNPYYFSHSMPDLYHPHQPYLHRTQSNPNPSQPFALPTLVQQTSNTQRTHRYSPNMSPHMPPHMHQLQYKIDNNNQYLVVQLHHHKHHQLQYKNDDNNQMGAILGCGIIDCSGRNSTISF